MSAHSASAPRPMAPSNRILEAGWAAVQHQQHQARLAAMKSTVDCRPPRTAKIRLNRDKKRIAKENELLRIDRDNRILLERMSLIQSKPSPEFPSKAELLSPAARKPSLNAFVRMQEKERILEENAALVARLKKGRGHINPEEFTRHEHDYVKLKEAASIARAAPAPLPPKIAAVSTIGQIGSSSDRSLSGSASTSSLHARPQSSAGLGASASAKTLQGRGNAAPGNLAAPTSPTVVPSPGKITRSVAETRDSRGLVVLIYADSYPAHQHASSHSVQLASEGRRVIDGRPVMITVDEITSIVVHSAPPKPSSHADSPAFKPRNSFSSPGLKSRQLLAAEAPGSVHGSPFLSALPSPFTENSHRDSQRSSGRLGGAGAPGSKRVSLTQPVSEQDRAHSFVFRSYDHARMTHDFVSVPWILLLDLPEAASFTDLPDSEPSRQSFARRLMERLRFHGGRLAFNPSDALGRERETVQAAAEVASALLGKSISSSSIGGKSAAAASANSGGGGNLQSPSKSRTTRKSGSTWDQIGSDGTLHGSDSPDLLRTPRSGAGGGSADPKKRAGTGHYLTQTTTMLVRAGVSASMVEKTIRDKQTRENRRRDFDSHRLGKDLREITKQQRERSRSKSPDKGRSDSPAKAAKKQEGLPNLELHQEEEKQA
jgi:hypothetical protein